jgi:hypothetical protein
MMTITGEDTVDARAADDLRRAVGYAVRAPSSHNSQPWRFRIRPKGIELRMDPTRRLEVVDPEGREQVMSCGAALFSLRCALENLGYAVRVDTTPRPNDPAWVASVECARSDPRPDPAISLAAIAARQTHRGEFLDRPVEAALIAALAAAAQAEGAWLARIEQEQRTDLARLVGEGDRLQCSDPRFRRELAAWLRPNTSKLGDGLAGYAIGLGGFMSRIAPLAIRTFDPGSTLARTDRKLVEAAPVLLVLATELDDTAHWLAAGQALDRVLLRAAADGLSAGFMNQPVQCAALRVRLNAMLDRPGFAQIVMRLGYAQLGKPSWRRPVQDVLER